MPECIDKMSRIYVCYRQLSVRSGDDGDSEREREIKWKNYCEAGFRN